MPKVNHVKKARKDNPAVKKGESYYWWKFRFGSKQYSKERPPRYKLTQSYFLSQLWNLEDNIPSEMNEEDVENMIEELNMLLDEVQSSYEAMPEQLQETSDSGILLYERIEALDEWISEIESIDTESLSPEEIYDHVVNSNPGIG